MFNTNGRAVTAVFLGAIGLAVYGIILGPIAAGLGVLSLTELRRGGTGRATAVAGIVLGVAAFTLSLVLASTSAPRGARVDARTS
jgi:hypothetical protein